MSEPSDRPVKITAAVRQHPAIRKLARACIELARQLRLDSPQHQSADASPALREQADA